MSGCFTHQTTWKQISQPCRLVINRPVQNSRARNGVYQIMTIDTIATLKVMQERIANMPSWLSVEMAVSVY
jgi:hypothetical protein